MAAEAEGGAEAAEAEGGAMAAEAETPRILRGGFEPIPQNNWSGAGTENASQKRLPSLQYTNQPI